MIEVKPPMPVPPTRDPIIFLGGSIDMGRASNWRGKITEGLASTNAVFINPWGDNFDPSTPQEADNAKFSAQVNWELDGLEVADILVFYFDATGKSPITLLELGMYVNSSKVVLVCCPEGFWRKGNVDIVCDRVGIQQVDTLEDLIAEIQHWVTMMNAHTPP